MPRLHTQTTPKRPAKGSDSASESPRTSAGGSKSGAAANGDSPKLRDLKWAWLAARNADRATFLRWLRGKSERLTAEKHREVTLIGEDGRLTLQSVRRIEVAMRASNLTRGQMMEQMGYARESPRLGFAMSRAQGWIPSAAFIERMALWLTEQERNAGSKKR